MVIHLIWTATKKDAVFSRISLQFHAVYLTQQKSFQSDVCSGINNGHILFGFFNFCVVELPLPYHVLLYIQ